MIRGGFSTSDSFDDLRQRIGEGQGFFSARKNEIFFFLIYFQVSLAIYLTLNYFSIVDDWKQRFLVSLITYLFFHEITQSVLQFQTPIYMIRFASSEILARIPFAISILSIVYSLDFKAETDSQLFHIILIEIAIGAAYAVETCQIKSWFFGAGAVTTIILLTLYFFEDWNPYITSVITIMITSCVHFFVIPEFSFCKGFLDVIVNVIFTASLIVLGFGLPHRISKSGQVFKVAVSDSGFDLFEWISQNKLWCVITTLGGTHFIQHSKSSFFQRNLMLGIINSLFTPRLGYNQFQTQVVREKWVIEEVKLLMYAMVAFKVGQIPSPFIFLQKKTKRLD